MRYQSSGAQIRNQISVFRNLWHRDVRYKICTAQGCRTAQTRNQIRVFGNVWHRDARYKICTAQGCCTDQTRRHRDALHIYGTAGMPRHGDALYIYIYINRNKYGTGMPDFWPIQLETGALPNVPFPPITLVFVCLPTSQKLLIASYHLFRKKN